jgi:pimeloyl-ACP methyl ester carboxylesterase
MNILKTLYALLLSSMLVSTACSKGLSDPVPIVLEEQKEFYVSSHQLASVSQSTLQQLVSAQGFSAYRDHIKHGVSVHRVVYNTTYRNQEIQASGIIFVPLDLTAPAPVLSAQHGTIFTEDAAPSNFNGLSGFELLAAGGYITLMPDYIGFGESKDVFHPYYDEKHSALAVVDFLKAGKAFYREQNIPAGEHLYLVGYSEGGYTTLAAQKEIETNPDHGLQITAVAAGAGGYDLTAMLGGVASGKQYPYPAYLAYVLQAYNKTNGWNRPLTDFFREPYASRLPGLFNFATSGGAINQHLTTDPKKMFTPGFFAALQKDGQEQQLKQALLNNSLQNWAPKSPTRLYHGTADEIVPLENTKRTYDRFVAQGAKQTEFIPISKGTHGSAFLPMLQSVIPWMQSFQED